MCGGAEEECQTRAVPCLDPIPDHGRHEMASLPIPDKLLGEILLQLPTPADLARASAACVSFRRVAAHRSFLRRYRKLHAPPLLGFFERSKSFYPVTPPCPSASADSAAALAADFSFSFLPAPARDWRIQDIRDGRVLLYRFYHHGDVFPELAVCDPLHWRYLLLPPITDDLAASVKDPLSMETEKCTDIFLAPPGYDEEAAAADETSFRVISMAQCKTTLAAFVFCSNNGEWRDVPSRWRSDLSACLPPLVVTSLFYLRHYVYGCFYWMIVDCEESKLLVLDVKVMEFSIAKPPPEADSCDVALVEAGEGRLGMFVLPDSGSDLSYFIRQNDGGSSSQWQKVKTISLRSPDHLICSMEKHLLLYKWQSSEAHGFTLDIDTFQLEKVCTLGSSVCVLRAYSNFPPSLLSSPTISSGVANRAEKEMLEQGCAASSSAQSPR
ncbi:unnamed protein product [Alopecurus aequalis]